MKLAFDTDKYNSFYIHGPNGSKPLAFRLNVVAGAQSVCSLHVARCRWKERHFRRVQSRPRRKGKDCGSRQPRQHLREGGAHVCSRSRPATYIHDFSSAKIRITLTNDGLNAHKSYAEKVVIERKIGTSTSYSLKSLDRNGRETVISERRADLDALLQHFGIDLENPLSWLSQDRSRQFLQDWKPKKLYEASAFTRDQSI